MTNICRRNDHDRNDALQVAYFNGLGYTAWENLWGCFNKMTDRDAEATRRVARLLRFFGRRLLRGAGRPGAAVVPGAGAGAEPTTTPAVPARTASVRGLGSLMPYGAA